MNGKHGMLVAVVGALLATPVAAQPATAPNEPDIAYAEYQRGRYVGAFKEAMRRVEEKSDPKSMTLLGELYADGLGVPNDDKKAAEWYKLAAARGTPRRNHALSSGLVCSPQMARSPAPLKPQTLLPSRAGDVNRAVH